ncbi:hypothetical protein GOP47_0020168 [Adiantum capillus-veneris]|uniref:Uncharacterized protein n=1 Tax=Adiantum capillus-veneris TaxID=13818 RepID=A0A9D4UCG6_ADICA|nr:hypothetical protein GOP47_0020168 [Adiantum capillus-veneris]
MDFEHSLLCCEEYISSPLVSGVAHDDDDASVSSASPSLSSSFVSLPPYSTMPAAVLCPDEDELTVPYLLTKQLEYKPDDSYATGLQSNQMLCEARRNAARWMIKAHVSHKFSPVTVAMAINYLDRYLQKSFTLPWKSWMMELLSVACLSVAAKMEEVDVPALLDLQIDGLEHLFQAKTVQRMELNVLSAINWRLRCVTPFSFIEKAISQFHINQHLKSALMMRASELLLGALAEVEFLSFDPSVLASTSLCFALEELLPLHSDKLKLSLLNYIPLDEGKLRSCYILLESLIVDPVNPSSSLGGHTKSPLSPTTVILHCEGSSSVDNSRDYHYQLSYVEGLGSQDECASNPKKQRRV